jgi:hypothetical protein
MDLGFLAGIAMLIGWAIGALVYSGPDGCTFSSPLGYS